MLKIYCIGIYTLLLLSLNVYAGDGDYAVSKIPVELLKNADVVKRMEEIRFEVVDPGKSRLYHKYALTILNENGDRYAAEVIFYDKLREVKSIQGTLYDAEGKKVKNSKKSEIKDLSAIDDISLIEDSRVKVHSFYQKIYPYTVEYETEMIYYNTYMFPIWDPIGHEKISVQQSSLNIIVPSGFSFRYKTLNYNSEPLIQTEKSNKVYKWEVKNLESVELEYASPSWSNIVPVVHTSPNMFEIDKYKGDISTWDEYGKFHALLNKGKDKLPDNIVQEVHRLTDDVKDLREKVRILYGYMQQNTRYISIQLGIGGLQPFDASYVANKKYGDCKALSNYMYSLLKEIGIKSYYTLVHAGENETYFLNDFPSDQFNHIIVCVPMQKDTIWLECTNQTLPAGYLSDFTSNRPVLLVDESGGKLVKTPNYGVEQNVQIRKAEGVVDNSGLLNVILNTKYRAVEQGRVHALISQFSKDKQKEYLRKIIDLPHYDVTEFQYKEFKTVPPVVDEHLEIQALNFASVTGKRLFINPNIISRFSMKLRTDNKRKYPIVIDYAYQDIDTALISVPSGYQPEAVPAPIYLNTKFGKYHSSIEIKDDKILYYRNLEKFSGQFPASEYNELVKFYDQIYKADRSRVVLVKNE